MDVFFIKLNTENIEKKELEKFHHKSSRLYLSKILKDYYGIEDEIKEEGGRPYIENNPVYFSISHSNSLLGIACSKNKIGFDIEFKKEKDYKKISKRMNFELENPAQEEFYKAWTKYEAELKSGFKNKIKQFDYENYSCSVSYEIEEEMKIINLS